MPDHRAGGGSGKAAASRDVARPARRAQVRSMRHGRARGNGHEQRTRLRTCANLPCPSSIAVIAMPSFDIVSEVDTHELTNARSEEPTSELQSLMRNSYAVCCLKKKNQSLLS